MDYLHPNDVKLLAHITKLAKAGEVAPPLQEMMHDIGIVTPSQMSRSLNRLIGRKLVQSYGAYPLRVFIISTGESTSVDPFAGKRGILRKKQTWLRSEGARRSQEIANERDEIEARRERDQAALRESRAKWLKIEQQKYNLPRMGRLVDEMPA